MVKNKSIEIRDCSSPHDSQDSNPKFKSNQVEIFFLGKWRRNFNKETLKETKWKEESNVWFDKKWEIWEKLRKIEIWELN